MRPLILSLALVGAGLSGCVQNYAEREIVQGREAALMSIVNAPAEARVVVDGRDMGTVGQYQAGLVLEPGRHDVAIMHGGAPIHQQAVFAAAGARIEVRVR